jgi:hypothetical protein
METGNQKLENGKSGIEALRGGRFRQVRFSLV